MTCRHFPRRIPSCSDKSWFCSCCWANRCVNIPLACHMGLVHMHGSWLQQIKKTKNTVWKFFESKAVKHISMERETWTLSYLSYILNEPKELWELSKVPSTLEWCLVKTAHHTYLGRTHRTKSESSWLKHSWCAHCNASWQFWNSVHISHSFYCWLCFIHPYLLRYCCLNK